SLSRLVWRYRPALRPGLRVGDGAQGCRISSMRFGFRQALVDHAKQCRRSERLVQAPRRTEAPGHFEASEIFRLGTGKGVAGNGDQRDRRGALMKYPDRFE